MAHQTFYIDIDEEITSIVERLKRAKASEIIIVVPKRALLIQSIVNLRILKKEADENDIQLMMVTQDKLGKMLIEKAGIFVQQKMDNISEEEISMENGESEMSETESDKFRLNGIGSQNYFSEEELSESLRVDLERNKKKIVAKKENPSMEKLTNKELVSGINLASNKKNYKSSLDISTRKFENSEILGTNKKEEDKQIDNGKRDKKIESFFFRKNDFENVERKSSADDFRNYNLSKKDHKGFIIFGIISFLAVVVISAYLFLPKATLTIAIKEKTESIDSSISGDIKINASDLEKEIIPAKIISVESSISEKFNASGNKAVSNQKARGKIIVYNEFSSSPQPLVATTRFLSSNGKIFRLVNGVTIPGMETTNGEIKPGTVEASVIADEAGESFNIGPDKFTIPGFEGSGAEKYAKFYAKSENSMSGGGSGNQTANFITDNDIAEAKNKVLAKLKNELKNKIKQSSGEESIILDDAIKEEEPIYKISNSSGDVADSFEISIQTKAKAMVVTQKDMNDITAKMIAKAKNGEMNIDSNSIKFDFGKANVDFDAGIIEIKFHAVGPIFSNLDLNVIKKEILGKSNDDLEAYLGTFSDIENASIIYWPAFINSRIPEVESRVEIILDK